MFINACSVEDQSQRNPPASVTKLPQLCPVFDVSESLRFVLRVSTLYFVFGEDARVSQRVSTYRFTRTHTHARARAYPRKYYRNTYFRKLHITRVAEDN